MMLTNFRNFRWVSQNQDELKIQSIDFDSGALQCSECIIHYLSNHVLMLKTDDEILIGTYAQELGDFELHTRNGKLMKETIKYRQQC
tara:strand:+ start:2813 stop:3073 length:261 start_codon:yes stop_codon:yes gene_type:complete